MVINRVALNVAKTGMGFLGCSLFSILSKSSCALAINEINIKLSVNIIFFIIYS
jgi:hypothetical protein